MSSNSNALNRVTFAPMVITLSLRQLHQSTPLQKWTFEDVPVIKIGRASDNHVILHSSVVSRYHLELRYIDNHWQVVALGSNGTYLDGESITNLCVADGMVIRLAVSGPQLQLHLGETAVKPRQKTVPSQNAEVQGSNQERETFLQNPNL